MYCYIQSDNFISTLNKRQPSVFFDVDHTVIRPKGNTKFYSSKRNPDWELAFPNVLHYLRKIKSSGYNIYFVTNQLKYDSVVEKRFRDLIDILNFDTIILIATERNKYRKPAIGLAKECNIPGGIPKINERSFHCGDALGRPRDFSDDDYWFGVNLGINVFSPEEVFSPCFSLISFPPIKRIHIPNPDLNLINILRSYFENYDGIMLIGLPGSGKSYIRNWIKDNLTTRNIEVFNQDTKEYCNKNVENTFYILDNTNLTPESRSKYPSFVFNKEIKKIYLDLQPEQCIRGVKYRTLFEEGKHIPDFVIFKLNKEKSLPNDIDLHIVSRPILDDNFPPYLLS